MEGRTRRRETNGSSSVLEYVSRHFQFSNGCESGWVNICGRHVTARLSRALQHCNLNSGTGGTIPPTTEERRTVVVVERFVVVRSVLVGGCRRRKLREIASVLSSRRRFLPSTGS